MKRLAPPVLLLLASLLVFESRDWWGALLSLRTETAGYFATGSRVAVWLAAILLATRALRLAVRTRILRRSGKEPPRLLLDVMSGAVWLAGLSVLAVVVFGVAPSAAFTTSGVMIAVVGFAVRHMVADLFYGITLALERPFEIGDWVELRDGVIGQVDELTWRAVKLVTASNQKVVIPNNVMSTEQLLNYDQPDPAWRKTLRITIGYDVPSAEAHRILLSAVQQVPASARIPREPDAHIVEYQENGAVWELRFWVPDFPTSAHVAQLVNAALLRSLYVAGIQVPRPREEVLVGRLEEERASESAAIQNWIERIALFGPLAPRERLDLQSRARRLEIPEGEAVVRQDEDGESLFVIHEGALDVWVEGAAGSRQVSTMGPGEVLGEMSLLTGAPRSATVRASVPSVVYEITKADFEPSLRRNADLARALAEILSERQLTDAEREASAQSESGAARRRSQYQLVQRIRDFFKLGDEA